MNCWAAFVLYIRNIVSPLPRDERCMIRVKYPSCYTGSQGRFRLDTPVNLRSESPRGEGGGHGKYWRGRREDSTPRQICRSVHGFAAVGTQRTSLKAATEEIWSQIANKKAVLWMPRGSGCNKKGDPCSKFPGLPYQQKRGEGDGGVPIRNSYERDPPRVAGWTVSPKRGPLGYCGQGEEETGRNGGEGDRLLPQSKVKDGKCTQTHKFQVFLGLRFNGEGRRRRTMEQTPFAASPSARLMPVPNKKVSHG